MRSEDKYFETLTEDELWQRYCGFLDLSIDEFIDIQKELLMDQIERVADSTLGKKIMNNHKPKSVEEFRRVVPLTTYDDYEPYLSEQRDDVLATKPRLWCHSTGRGGRFKWFPHSYEFLQKSNRNFLGTTILASSSRKGQVNIGPGFRFLLTLPPPPYASGSAVEFFSECFSHQRIPPPEMVKDMEFREKIQRGFEIALKEGVDVLSGISSILVKMGEGFAEQSRTTKFSASMLHPKIIYRLLRAIIRSKRAKRPILPKDLWSPKAIVCGGLDTSIYKEDIAYYWGSEPFDFYITSETLFVAMQAWNKKAMSFIPDSVFLEFIPHEERRKGLESQSDQPATVLLNEVEQGKLYEVVITQFYGMPLLRYRLNDIIKIASLKDEETGGTLPQIIIQGRVGETINLAGLAELDEKTIWRAIANTGIKFADWLACKEFEHHQGSLHLYIELKEEKEVADVEAMIDEQLKIVDVDYRDIDSYLGLQPVRVTLLSPTTFERYAEEKRKEGADLAQLKPTHVNPPESTVQRFLELSEACREER